MQTQSITRSLALLTVMLGFVTLMVLPDPASAQYPRRHEPLPGMTSTTTMILTGVAVGAAVVAVYLLTRSSDEDVKAEEAPPVKGDEKDGSDAIEDPSSNADPADQDAESKVGGANRWGSAAAAALGCAGALRVAFSHGLGCRIVTGEDSAGLTTGDKRRQPPLLALAPVIGYAPGGSTYVGVLARF